MKLNTLIATAAVATPFSTGFLYKLPTFDFFLYYALAPVLLLLGFTLSGAAISAELMLFIAVLLIHALWSVALFDNSLPAALSQLAGIAAVTGIFHYMFRINHFDVFKIFRIYLRLAVAVCCIALLQMISFLLHLEIGYDFSAFIPEFHLQLNQLGLIRVQGPMQEPAHFGIVIGPALFVAILNLSGRTAYFMPRWQSIVVVLAAAASFSVVTYTAILLALTLVAWNRGLFSRLIAGLGGLAAALLVYLHVPDVQLRIDDTIALLLHQSMATANWSSLAVYNNAVVAWQSLLNTDLFGGGLGSHPFSFAKYSLLYGISEIPLRYALLNNADASSLLLRIASELGAPGLLAAAVFLLRFHVRRTARVAAEERALLGGERLEWIVSNAALVFLAVSLLRQGHYFNYGLPLFGLLYLEAGRSYRAALSVGRRFAVREQPA